MMLFCHICGHQKKEFTCFTSVTWECTNENCGKKLTNDGDGDFVINTDFPVLDTAGIVEALMKALRGNT